MKYKRTI